MKDSIKRIFLIGIGMLIVLLVNFFYPNILSNNKEIILLLVAFVALKLTVGIDLNKDAGNKRVIRNILIYVLIYYLITYLSGLFIGFNRAIYSYSLTNLTKNILPTFIIIVLSELLRNQMIKKSDKNMKINVFTCIIFVLLEASVNFKYYNFTISDDVYLYIGLIVIGSISKNILLTVLNNKTDVYPGIIYRLLIEELKFVLLIVPALGPYLTSVAMILLPTLIAVMVLNMSKKDIKEKPKQNKRRNKLYFIVVAILLILVLLNTGLMKYQIMVIGSNSMKDYMARGDVIFLERLKNDKKNNVDVGEILVFRYDNKIISHRVIEKLKRDTGVYYETKGDANDQPDGVAIDKDKVIGKVLFRVKYIGLPSVWLSDLFK